MQRIYEGFNDTERKWNAYKCRSITVWPGITFHRFIPYVIIQAQFKFSVTCVYYFQFLTENDIKGVSADFNI